MCSSDLAVDELSQSFSGFTRRLERMFPELKSLSEEAKMAGDAVNLIAESVSGMAEQAMQSGVGSVQAYRNAIEALRRSIGQDWENATRGFRVFSTNFINRLTEMRELSREQREAALQLQQAWANYSDEGGAEELLRSQLRDAEARLNAIQNSALQAAVTAESAGERVRAALSLDGILQQFQVALTPWRDHSAHFARNVEEITENVEDLREQVAFLDTVTRAVEAAYRALDAAEAEGSARAAEAAGRALGAAERARAAADAAGAEVHARAAEAEIQYIERLKEQGRIRAENLEYLEREIEMIMQKAQIEGRGTRTLEVQRRVLNARINAYTNLVRQIGAAGEAERRTLEELQREYLRLEIETANRLQEDNLRGLENRRREIETLAGLEGRAADSIRTQNELLDANVNAYQNQMRILRDLIDGTREEESARRAALEVQWMQYAQEKQTARAQRARLQEAIRLQDELNQRVSRMHESAYGAMRERDDLIGLTARLQRAREESERYEEDRVAAAIRADSAIAEHRLATFRRTLDEERRDNREAIRIAREDGRHAEANQLMLNMRSWQRQAHERTAEEIQRIYAEMLEGIYGRDAEARILNLRDAQIKAIGEVESALMGMASSEESARTHIYQQFANKRVEIERRAAEQIREINRQMIADINSGFDMFLDAFQNIANNISTIWTNSIDRQTQEKLRANDAMVQSDEERAAKERRILKEAAFERYKAELFAWTANVTFATAQAGMATLTAFAEALKGTGPAGPAIAAINAALVAAVSATKVAAVISAKPNPPRFHTGGVVRGRVGQDVPAILRTNERVFTEGQFNSMQTAFANLANMAYRPAAPGYNVQIINKASRDVSASVSFDAGRLIVEMEKIVGDGIAKGKYDAAFDKRDMRNGGRGMGTF